MVSKYTILVVDDDFAMRRGIALTLQGEGYTVFEAVDFPTAIEILAINKIDLSVLDLFLPGRDGLELANEIKESSPDTRILIVTAHTEYDRAKVAQQQFQKNFLDKSKLERLLTKKVRNIFGLTN